MNDLMKQLLLVIQNVALSNLQNRVKKENPSASPEFFP